MDGDLNDGDIKKFSTDRSFNLDLFVLIANFNITWNSDNKCAIGTGYL